MQHLTILPEPQRMNDRFFDPWREPQTNQMIALCNEVQTSIYDYELYHKARLRRRRSKDQASFELTVRAVVCDLAHAALMEDDRGIAISRSKDASGRTKRYHAPACNERLPYVLDLLGSLELGWLFQQVGFRDPQAERNQRTLIWPTEKLKEKIEGYGITLSDIGRSDQEEVIILKGDKPDYWTDPKPVDYQETDLTSKLRANVKEINRWIGSADIRFEGKTFEVQTADLADRSMKRHFSRSSFESGGRLFGGFWQSLSKAERKTGLTINGEPVVALDYGQMAIRTAYSIAGERPDDGDLYAIPGLSDLPGGPYRAGVKKLMNSMMFTDGRLGQKPRGTKDLLPKGLTIQTIEELIRRRHQPIDHLFGTQVGHQCQFIESEILIDVILKLQSMSIHCLPVHDCILAGQSHAGIAEEVMREASRVKLGYACPISRE